MTRFSGLVSILLCVFLAGCSINNENVYEPQAGDLLFQIAPRSGMGNAVAQSTAWNDSLKFSHVGIVAVENGKPYVVEAASVGVKRTEWSDFLSEAEPVGGKTGVVAMRVDMEGFVPQDAVARALLHIGEPYDWSFYPDNGKMYCSELVYESYRLPDGSPLFSAQPMNFRDSAGNIPAFWVELFERLGESIPEGLPGTNPNDLAKDTALKEVYRWF